MQNINTEMPKEVVEGYRLSPQQRHLWSLQQIDHSLPYRTQCTVLIEGDINTNIFKAALAKVVNRYEILRTNFLCLTGMTIPFQVINDSSTLSVNNYDFSNFAFEEQDTKIEALFDELSQLPLNLEQDLPLQISLITLLANKHTLLIGLPAMSADPKTLRNLIREISRCYAACLCGEELSDEPLQYADIAEWQNDLLEGEEGELGRTYWHQKDVSELLTLKLPCEYQPSKNLEFKPQLLTTTIHPDLAAKIAALAQKYDTSASVLLLACWQILLWRLTNHPNIIVGMAYDGRKYEELEEALGLFAKYLPIHGYLQENLQFSQVLQQLDETVNEVYEWQDYFTWEQNKNSLESYFFPFSFEFDEQSTLDTTGNIIFKINQHYSCIERFKLKLSCIRQDNFFIAKFNYDSNLFQAVDIERLAAQFQKLLAGVTNHPKAVISDLEILSDCERQQLLVEFNDTQTDYPKDKCINHLFEEQVERTPDKFAVTFQNQQLTYYDLNYRANQLAHYLKMQGVGPEVLVGICTERSLEMIIGILGILKAGGAYVPIDPAYPQERLAFILEDTQTPVILTQERLLKILPAHKANIICLDTEWETIAQQSQKNPASTNTSENLAYVIYTSGSTGKPKGVQITHQNLVHSTSARINYYQEPVNRFLLLSSFAFDSSIAGIFWTICQGGNLFLPQTGEEQDLPTLIELITQNHLSHLLTLPSLYTLLLEQAKPEQLVSLCTVIVAGESCSKTLVNRHQELLPKVSLFNEYGPTEGTVWSSVCSCDSPQFRTQVSIGRPIANTQIYILNSHLHPVPLGVPGEMYIGGDGLARGYLNRPELTAEKFIPNHFSNEPGVRLYKTGDLGRYLPDGNIEFLGRIDRQVKIRGFRIELGEIETVLSQHPKVRSLAVIDREDASGNKRLVAYLVPHQGQLLTTKEMRLFLRSKLPDYMMPSAFVRLKTLPHLPNGKVDIKALPAPETVRSDLSGTFVAPRTAVEKTLAEIWAKVLRVEQIGIHDNFFELGGDSILSIQIVAKANQAGLHFLPKQLFDHQTIAEFAAVAGTKTRTIPAEQGLVTGEVPLTPIQYWFFAQNQPEPHHWNQAILLTLRKVLNPLLLEKVIQQLLVHHDALRLRFIHQEAGWQQSLGSADEAVVVTMIDLSTVPEVDQESALEAAAAKLQTSLNLSSGTLVRVALFDLGANKPSRLLIIIHHLAIDGVSWRILLEDLQTLCEQMERGEAMQLPAKTTSCKHWAERLTEYAQSAAVQEEIDYWFAEPRRDVSPIPVDFLRGDNTLASARTISVSLTLAETQALLKQVPAAYQTQINDVLLTALVQAFEQWTGNKKLLIDLEGHGREDIFNDVDLSRTVGWFTTHFPVLLNLEEISHPPEALKTVKQQLHSIPNRGLGYGVLRYLCSDEAIGSKLPALPQPEVLFNYLGQTDQVLSESPLFAPAQESSGSTRSLRSTRSYLLEVNSIVAGGQLQVNWTYSQDIHDCATIEHLALGFMQALREIIVHCQSPEVDHHISYDLLLTKFSQQELEAPLVKIQPQGSKRPLFFVHPVGGNVFCYHELGRCLGLDQPLYGLQAPGLYGEREPHTSIEDMATHYIATMRLVQPEGPYVLAGWSMGSFVAFEMATQLQKHGVAVDLLGLFDNSAPGTANKAVDINNYHETEILANFAKGIANSAGKNLSGSYSKLQQLEAEEQLNYVLQQLQVADVMSADMSQEQFSLFFKVYKSNVRAILSYLPQQVYTNRIILFCASNNSFADPDDPSLGWSRFCSKPVKTITVPGDHYSMFTMPDVQVLAQRLSAILNEV